MVDGVEEALNISFHNIPKLPILSLKGQVSNRVIGTRSDSIPIADIEKILLLDSIQEPRDRSLHNVVFSGGHPQRAFFPIVFWNICSSDQFRFIRLLL